MVAPQRQKTVHGIIPVHMVVHAMAQMLAWSGEGAIQVDACQSRMRRLIDVKLDGFAASSTPYGKMIQQCQFPGGGILECWNLSVALWYISNHVPQFGDFLRALKKEKGIQRFTMIIYEDGFKVGNVLRPDKGRGLDAVFLVLEGISGLAEVF